VMFDQLPSTSRQQSDALTITLAVPAVGDVMLLGVVASSVTVTLPDVTRTVTLTSSTEQSVYITGLGSAGGNLTITIQPVLIGMSMILRVAEILVGTVIELGETQLGAGVGISDYSTRTIDEYGNASFVRRGYSGFLQAQFTLDRDDADLVLDTITALRAVPCVWIGSLHYQCAVIYGYYREASMEVMEAHAECSMRIDSLAVDTLTGTVSGGGGGGGGGTGGGGWWGDWTGWEQPAPPTPAGDVVLLVRGESWPLTDASALARSIAVTGVMDASAGASPALFGSTTSVRALMFPPVPFATATASTTITAAGDFCAECFVRIPSAGTGSGNVRVFTFGTLSFRLRDATGSVSIYNGTTLLANVDGVVSLATWYHVAVTRRSGAIYIYLNGTMVLQYAYAASIDMTSVLIFRTLSYYSETIGAYFKYARITTGDSVYSGASFPPLTSGY
jgi:hypothetical protein